MPAFGMMKVLRTVLIIFKATGERLMTMSSESDICGMRLSISTSTAPIICRATQITMEKEIFVRLENERWDRLACLPNHSLISSFPDLCAINQPSRTGMHNPRVAGRIRHPNVSHSGLGAG